ncbi:metal ABC transporter solute-binding protein, Zn/Mn family [Halomonas sp. E19]|uniref:metal ABC transporter solute-binding protein, Zn/Mn family n=1 Tax=unclassified Halomonas TaxID=2609666 RepID=UPI0040338E86
MRFTRPALAWLAVPFVAMAGNIPAAAASPKVIASFSVLGDLVHQVGGHHIDLVVLTPPDAEVHQWELTPQNFIAMEDADLVFYNGYQLEQWIRQIYATVGNRARIVPLAEASGYPTQPIITGELTGEPDPHLWMDPRAVSAYIDVIAEQLSELHPAAAESFQARAEAARNALASLHEELLETLADIPESQRLLITSEAAFVYFADAYDFRHDSIWGSNAESASAPHQVMRIMQRIEQTEPPALFWESTVSDRYMRSIARDTGIEMAGPLYVDSLSEAGGPAQNYIAMMRHNARLIRDALGESEQQPEGPTREAQGANEKKPKATPEAG